MRLRGHERAFVAAPPDTVYAALADTPSYARWWPGTSGRDGRVRLPLARGGDDATPSGHRPGIGLWLELPTYDGSLEWYLEPFEDGTIVNAFLDVVLSGRRLDRRLLRYRTSVRRGLFGLKSALEDR
jgi:uncharacterized protein YndB with AHSA1/START domain